MTKITICGSMAHLHDMITTEKQLKELGYEVEIPNPSESERYATLPHKEQIALKQTFIREHQEKINDSDAILVFNKQKRGIAGYIGGNTLMEMAFAYAQNLEIFLLENATELTIADEIYGMNPIELRGDIQNLHHYFSALPKTYISSKSPVKAAAISRGLRRAGIYTQVIAVPTHSHVSEQPMSIDETYEGAMNRHENLKNIATDASYLATIESGLHTVHPNHNVFGCTVAIIEKSGHTPKIGIELDIEYPRDMTDKIPSIYPDVGILVQQEYGSTLKDPYPYFTNGKITRAKLLENTVYNVAVQL